MSSWVAELHGRRSRVFYGVLVRLSGFVRGATRAFRAFAKRLQAGLSRLRKGLQGLMVEPPHDFRFQGPTTTPVQHST